jgi:hypothetical protein
MLTNAAILRIDVPSGSTPQGTRTWTNGATMSGMRIVLDEVKRSQSWGLGEVVKDAEACAYVPDGLGLIIDETMRVTMQLDGEAARTYQVVYVRHRVKEGGLSHREVFVKGV